MALTPLGMSLMMAQTPRAPERPGTVGPTDVLGAYNLSSNVANQQYLAKLQQQNALWGGLAGAGAAGIASAPAWYKMYQGLTAPTAPVASPGSFGAAAADYVNPASTAALPTDALAPYLASGQLAGLSGGATADAAGAGTVAGDLAAAAPVADASLGAAAGADAAGMSLADLLPFLFA